MGETKAQREERLAQEAADKAAAEQQVTNVPVEEVQPFKLSEEGFDVTQPPPSDNNGKSVDFEKTTMPVVGSGVPSDFDPASNR